MILPDNSDGMPALETSMSLTTQDAGDLAVTKSHGAEMDMAEVVQWIGANFGSLTVRDALQQAAFMLCCDVISQDIAKAPLQLRERLSNDTSRVVHPEEHDIAAMLALEPNERMSWFNFSEMAVLWFCFTKNGFAVVLRDNLGNPTELIPVQSGRVVERVTGREVFYQVVASTLQEQALLGASSLLVPSRDMIHVRGRMVDGMDGYSTLVAGRTTLETGKSIEDFRDNLFAEDGQTRGVFRKKTPGILDDQAFQRLRTQLRILMSRFKTGIDPIVLEDDMEFQPISSKPSEMELTKQFEAQVIATARLLRVPPHKLFQMDGIKYENLETSEKMYVGDTLLPVAKPFEQQFAKLLLTKKERLRYFFEYDRDAMTLRDSKVQTDRLVRSLAMGAITFDEYRAALGWNPMPNKQGTQRMVPSNMNVIDENGNVVIGASAKGGDSSGGDTSVDQGGDSSGSTSTDTTSQKDAAGIRLVASNPAR